MADYILPFMRTILMTALLLATSTAALASPAADDYYARADRYFSCATPLAHRAGDVLDQAAVLYPRFGVAWREYMSALRASLASTSENATSEQRLAISAEQDRLREQFINRMLRTAEPGAVEFYNAVQTQLHLAIASCGPAPVRGSP